MKNIATKITMITSVALIVVLGLVAQGKCGGVVYPTGDYPDDIINVQNAVDGGGLVVLKATDEAGNAQAFNFGIYNFVSPAPPWMLPHGVHVDNGVIIKGETINGEMTTILLERELIIIPKPPYLPRVSSVMRSN